MEVVTIFTSHKEVLHLFEQFIYSYPRLYLTYRDDDTAYFEGINDDKSQLYYHYKLNDPEHEFSYNYSAEDVAVLRKFYINKHIFMFDMSYKPENLLTEILKAFRTYIKSRNENLLPDVMISHTFDGLKILEKDY